MSGREREYWSPNQIMLIKSVEQLPIIYSRTYQPPNEADLSAAWSYVSLETAMPQSLCKLRWSIIRWSYLKIHLLIDYGFSREFLESHPLTRKYLDGSLNFLIPLLEDFSEDDIAEHVHRRFDKVFDLNNQALLDMIDLWMRSRELPHAQCCECCNEWPEHDVSYLYNQVQDMNINYDGKIDEEAPSTSSSGCQAKGGEEAMCISSDSEEEE